MAVWDRYKSSETSFETRVYVGSNFKIRFFCDDPNGGVYVAKAPVVKLLLEPLVQFINTNILWDISESNSATSTLDTFDIAWGGTTDIGDLTAQVSGVDPQGGNVQYTTAGIYTVTASFTDTLGVTSSEQKIQVTIIDTDDFINLQRLYIGTTNGGGFYLEPNGVPTAINTGLSGDDLKFRVIRMHPSYKDLPTGQHHLLIATAAGFGISTDGGASYTLTTNANLGTPVNDAGDITPPVSTDLDNIDIAFDPQDDRVVYLMRTTATRTWLYTSEDYGVTWSNTQAYA